jgi:hypothetical protein
LAEHLIFGRRNRETQARDTPRVLTQVVAMLPADDVYRHLMSQLGLVLV